MILLVSVLQLGLEERDHAGMSSTYGFALLSMGYRLKQFMTGALTSDQLIEILLSMAKSNLPKGWTVSPDSGEIGHLKTAHSLFRSRHKFRHANRYRKIYE
jgi:hypothetical protein